MQYVNGTDQIDYLQNEHDSLAGTMFLTSTHPLIPSEKRSCDKCFGNWPSTTALVFYMAFNVCASELMSNLSLRVYRISCEYCQ